MLSKNDIKFITSLTQKKYRIQEGLFIAEGVKLVSEMIQSHFGVHQLFATSDFKTELDVSFITRISEMELKKISQQVSPNEVVGIFKIPIQKTIDYKGLILVLDSIQDPGNMGTIIRLCDWFGVSKLVCSPNTVDCFNPKVVQSTMGSLARVAVYYIDLENYLLKATTPVFLSLLDGKNVYQKDFPEGGIIVMGNEANGISNNLKKTGFQSITIPRFGENSKAESLNVATATAILLSEFRR